MLDDRQQRYLADLVTFTPSQRKAADTNGDGNVTINDATRIQMYAAELIDHLG
nr:dockerin type I domain-containing protein [uncultured Ruminococcus sp.]